MEVITSPLAFDDAVGEMHFESDGLHSRQLTGWRPQGDSDASESIQASMELPRQSGTPKNEQQFGTILRSKARQLRWDLVFCLGMVPVSILLFLYVYAALISDNPHLGPLLFSPSRTLLIVTILSQGLAIIFRILFNNVFDKLRWHFASREKGVAATTFLGLSPAASSLAVVRLLYETGICGHTLWSIQRCAASLPQAHVGFLYPFSVFFSASF